MRECIRSLPANPEAMGHGGREAVGPRAHGATPTEMGPGLSTRALPSPLRPSRPVLPSKRGTQRGYLRSTIFTESLKLSASIRQKYTPEAASTPRSSRPSHTAVWKPASPWPSTRTRTS